MHPRTKFTRLVAAVAVATVAIAAAPAAAGTSLAIGRDRLASAVEPCPLATTIEAHDRVSAAAGGYFLDAALTAMPRSESGFECPINRTPASDAVIAAELHLSVATRPASFASLV